MARRRNAAAAAADNSATSQEDMAPSEASPSSEEDHQAVESPIDAPSELPNKIGLANPSADEKGLQQSTTVCVFWAYFVVFVSLLTLVFVLLSTVSPVDEQAEFFAMPPDVRHHSTLGKMLKIELGEARRPIRIFVREEGPVSGETVVLVHGLGASSYLYRHVIPRLASQGLHVIAIDFPGAGLSEKPVEGRWGLLAKFREIYEEISEKGIFWRFEQLFETGALPDYTHTGKGTENMGLDYNADVLADSLDQVVNLLVPTPVHIVLHDTGVEAGSAWMIRNPSRVRSVTLIDTLPGGPSFPVRVLDVPGFGFIITWSSFLHQMLLRVCCVAGITQADAESYAFLLRSNQGSKATLEMWNRMNLSFDVAASMEGLEQLPVQVLWSSSSGKYWQEMGEVLASRLSGAVYLSHSGGRWPQEDVALEISEGIHQFISSLPQTEQLVLLTPQLTPRVDDSNYDYPGHAVNHGHGHYHGHEHHNHDDGHGHHSHDHGQGYHMHDHGPAYPDGMGLADWV